MGREHGMTLGEALIARAFAEVGKERLVYFREVAKTSGVPREFNRAMRVIVDKLGLDWQNRAIMREVCGELMGERFRNEKEAQYAATYAQCVAAVKWEVMLEELIAEAREMLVVAQGAVDERAGQQRAIESEVAEYVGVEVEGVLERLKWMGRSDWRYRALVTKIECGRQMIGDALEKLAQGRAKIEEMEMMLKVQGEELIQISAGMYRLQEMANQEPERGVVKKLKYRYAVSRGRALAPGDLERVRSRVEECFDDRKVVARVVLLGS